MRDLVLVPSFFRPDYLALTLEHLAAATGGSEKEVWVSQDRKSNDANFRNELLGVREVARRFQSRFRSLRYTERCPPHSFIGNPYNFLELYKEAYGTDARYVYLVEDDVLVAQDFFRWHEAVQERADYYATVAWLCFRNPNVLPSNNPLDYIETTCDYSSIGVCWKRENLAPVVEHARFEYYQNLTGYMAQKFSDNPIPVNTWTEQAGLIMRTLLATPDKYTVAWPTLPRCAHIGVRGYHRMAGPQLAGSLDQRIAALRLVSQSTAQLLAMGQDKHSRKDVFALPHIPEWEAANLRVVQSLKWTGKL